MDINALTDSILGGKPVREAIKESVQVSESTQVSESSTGILNAKEGDKILDTKTNKVGTVTKITTSGNYNIVHIDFDGKVRKVNAMDDAQTKGRYEFAKDKD